MTDRLVQIADGFWNVRGSFKIAGLIDVGTQMSLVRRKRGDFVLLDAYTLKGHVEQQVLALTDQGRAVSAVLNLHPFHTLHVTALAQRFPEAKLYGTRRHLARAPDLKWEPLHTEDGALHELFSEDFRFTIPRGVEFAPAKQNLHFASVLALHLSSGTLHVDDTLTWLELPFVRGLRFHPTLRFVLHKRPRAAADFRGWTHELLNLCEEAEHLCTAHGRALPALPTDTGAVARALQEAVTEVDELLADHERRYG